MADEKALLLPPYPPKAGKPGRSTLNRTARSPSDTQATVAALGTIVPVCYGRVRVGARVFAVGIYGHLYIGAAWCAGEIDGYEWLWINDQLFYPAGDGGNVSATNYTGTPDQQPDPDLARAIRNYNDACVLDADDDGTPDLGVAYSAIRIAYNSSKITGWPRSIIAQLRGLRIYDPRENHLLHSNDLSASDWTPGSSSLTLTTDQTLTATDAGGGPYGYGAQLWTQGSAPAGSQHIDQPAGTLAANNTVYAIVKQDAGTGLGLSIYDADTATHHRAWFAWDASGALTVDSAEAGASAAVRHLWDGWWIASASYAAPSGEQGNSRTALIWIERNGHESSTSSLWVAGVGMADQSEYHGIAHTTDSTVTAGTRYSDNPALCLADFRSNTAYGMGKTVNWPSVGRAANFNDRMVGSPPEQHRTLGLVIDRRRSQDDWTETLRAYAGCAVVPIDGEDHLIPDYKADPVASLGISDVLAGTLQVDRGGRAGMPNVVSITYTDVFWATSQKWDQGVATITSDAVRNGTEARRESRVQMPAIQRYSQAMREAVERYRAFQNDLRVRFRTLGQALPLNIMNVVTFTHPIGLTDQLLRLVDAQIVRPGEWELTFVAYSDALYDDSLYELPDHGYTGLPDPADIPAVVGLAVSEHMEQQGGSVITRLIATWNETDYAYIDEYQLQILDASGTVLHDQSTQDLTLTSGPVLDGATYTIRARVQSATGIAGPWAEITHEVVGSLAAPGDVPWVKYTAEYVLGSWLGRVDWGEPDDIDIAGYRVRRQSGNNADWLTAEKLHTGLVQGPFLIFGPPPTDQITYLVKAVDVHGNESEHAAWVLTSYGDDLPYNIVINHDHHANGFLGTRIDASVDPETGDLIADEDTGGAMWAADDSTAMWAADDSTAMWPPTSYLSPQYLFSVTVDERVPNGTRMYSRQEVTPDGWAMEYRDDGNADMWTGDSNAMWSTDSANQWNANADPWTAWPGSIQPEAGQRYQFRLTVPGGAAQGRVTQLKMVVDVPDRTETHAGVSVPDAGVFIPADTEFIELVAVNLTLQGSAGAVTPRVINKSSSGAEIRCYDAAGNPAAGVVDAIFKGY